VVEHFRPPPFHPRRPGLVAPVRVDPTGAEGPTRRQSRGPRWRQSSRGLFVPSYVDLTPDQRIVEAGVLLAERGGAVTGWAGLHWLGGWWFDGSTAVDPHGLPVELALASDLRPRAGVTLCEERLNPREVVVVDGLPVTIAERSAAFLARRAGSLGSAVQAVCMAAFHDLASLDEVGEYAGAAPRQGLSGWTGIPQCRKAVALADENCWSPTEVSMMLVWRLHAGLPAPLMNRPVFDLQGRHIGTPDLLDVESGTVFEYDGAVHLEAGRRAHDVRREEDFRDLGLEYCTLLSNDLAAPLQAAQRMHAARRRARWEDPEDRRWTVDPPTWWIPTTTVAERRALTPAQRRRLLRHRQAA
jgi:hypothetical protein